MFAVTGYEISLWIHITAAVVGLGATFGEALFFPVAMKLDPRHLPFVHAIQLAINRYLAGPALLIILITGIYQTSDGNWDFGSFWISATLAIVIVIGAINGAYFIRTDKQLGPMVAAEIAAAGDGPVRLSDGYQAKARQEGIVGALVGVLVIAAIFLMVVKPGA